jgi:uncharacterized protein (TIGR02246 family)
VLLLASPLGALAQAREVPAPLPTITLPPHLDRVLRDYEVAWRASDENALAQLFADGRVVVTNSGRAVVGRDAVRDMYANGGGPLSLRALAYAADDSVAHIIGAYAVRPVEGEVEAEDSGTFVLALVRQSAGKWLITADMDRSYRR